MSEVATARATHQVLNQARPSTGWNAFSDDRLLVSLVEQYAPWVLDKAARLGAHAGDEATHELARLANRHAPELKTHDRFGNRVDWVEFHPAWHELMSLAFGSEVHSLAWTAGRPGAHFARGVLSYVWNQIEQGVGCPLGMTYAAYPGLAQPEFAAWREKILSTRYDKRPLPLGKNGALRRDHQGWARLSAHRPQVVLLGASVGRLLHAGSRGCRRVVLLRAGLPARRGA
jgi:putative acyl-CoA dehydrogenase